MKNKEEEDGGDEEGQKEKRSIENSRRRAINLTHRSSVFRRQPSTPAKISFDPNNNNNNNNLCSSSSRKLAASLWEFYQYDDLTIPPAAIVHHRAPYDSSGPSNLHRHGKAPIRDNSLNLTDEQVAPYNAEVIHRRAGEANNNLKTSNELLKVLNRIWSLEEQHSGNISLIKALKTELAHSRARIKGLLRCQETDRSVMKDHDRLRSPTVHSLEKERKLRKRSESLRMKLARELSEMKSEMERGNKSKKILERLCDEFAKGIKNYEVEIRRLKQKKGWSEREQDRMLLCIAESWLDERIQSGENGSVLDKLEFEIETFLKTKTPNKKNRRSSLESVKFNALSAPIQEVDSEDDEEDSQCFELKKHRKHSPSSLQVKFEDQMAWAMSSNEKKKSNAVEVEYETEKCGKEKNNAVGAHERLLSETRGIDEGSCSYQSRRPDSPIRHWNPRAITSDHGVKESTLRDKLDEARTKSFQIKRF